MLFRELSKPPSSQKENLIIELEDWRVQNYEEIRHHQLLKKPMTHVKIGIVIPMYI